MKNKFIKIIISFLLLITPIMHPVHNVNAVSDCMWVDASKIDLSPQCLLNSRYLNSTKMKEYLVRCLEQSQCFSTRGMNEIKFKFMQIEFFFFSTMMCDSKGRPLLRLWVPENTLMDRYKGTLYSIPLKSSQRLRSLTF